MEKRVFLCIGSDELEKKIRQMTGFGILDSDENLDTVHNLMEFLDTDYIIINRLLDEEGRKLLDIAKEAQKRKIQLIVLLDEYESYSEKKLITSLMHYDVFAYIKLSELTEEKLQKIIDSYPEHFDFDMLKTQTDEEEDPIDSSRPVSFKKLVLTIWDNAEFGCELAYFTAKAANHSVLLIDLDLLSPKADMLLNIPKYPDGIRSQGIFTMSGLNIILDAIEKNIFTPELFYEAAIRRKENKNLYVLTGNYSMENYEYYSGESLTKLIEYAYRSFEITILLVNKSIYDEYTFRTLAKSDYNIVAIKADLPTVREYNRYIMFLKELQQIPTDKTKFAAYEYVGALDLNEKLVKEVVEGNYIGSIRYSRQRQKYRNLKAAYVRRMEDSIKSDYIKLLANFNIIVRRSWKAVLKAKFIKAVRPLRKLIRHKLRSRQRSAA